MSWALTGIAGGETDSARGCAAGLTDDELARQSIGGKLDAAFLVYQRDQAFECASPELGDAHAHSGQRRRHETRDGNVVETGQRDVVRNAQAVFGQREQATE